MIKNILGNYKIIIAGLVIGVLASLLSYFGNPLNMGLCVACFTRDIAGALGLHRASVVQYIRPELIGLILGSFAAAVIFKEYKARSGSSSIIRFCLGFSAMTGALVFLGCTWRALLRFAGGDINGLFGIIGIVIGVCIGIFFLRRGFTLQRNYKSAKMPGFVPIIVSIGLLTLLITKIKFSEGGAVFFSEKGPGSLHAPILISLCFAFAIGFIAQRTRFCTIGGIRDLILLRDSHLFLGIIAFVLAAFSVNIITGNFRLGMADQPIAHTNIFWNIFSMTLSALAFTLAGGCPARQFILSGEGDGDSFVFILGMLVGAAFAHNFNLASSNLGVTVYGMWAVIICFAFCIILGLFMREKTSI